MSATVAVGNEITTAIDIGKDEVIHRLWNRWEKLCDETRSAPFHRPEWIAAYLRAFEPNSEIVLLTANADERLLPGMFASVDLVLPREDHFVMLPETAIVYNPYGNAVYVVERSRSGSGEESLVARQHFVTLGDTRGDQVSVVKGVKPGDEVVTAGQLKLHNGSVLLIDNAINPTADAAPVPVDR